MLINRIFCVLSESFVLTNLKESILRLKQVKFVSRIRILSVKNF